MGRQGDPAYIRTVYGNFAEERWPVAIKGTDALVSDQCANRPASSRVSASARTVFDLSSNVTQQSDRAVAAVSDPSNFDVGVRRAPLQARLDASTLNV